MAVAEIKTSIPQGDDISFNITTQRSDGSSIDWVGGSANYYIRENDQYGDIVVMKTHASGIVMASGTLTISLNGTDTSTLSGDYWHGCAGIAYDGIRRTVGSGKLIIREHGL